MKYPYATVREHKDEMKASKEKEAIIIEFARIINTYSIENDSDTPDFIIAEYLFDCLMAANILIGGRSAWYNQGAKYAKSSGENPT